ncbi:MAG TPA: hypothetical protein VNP71_01085 [Thermoplasmata archaeon]|nr:hypothetical protein [Thermoplasmata archaeon]
MDTEDRGWRGFYRTGGVAMIAASLLVLVTLPLIPILIPSLAPTSVQSGLESIHSQSLLFGTTWGLYLVSDLLYLIPFPALYVVLRQQSRAAALIALIFNSLFVTIDVGVDIPLRLSLIGLSNSYASANPAGQAAYAATAQLAMDLANITALIATFVQFAAVILVSYAMLRDTRFRRSAAYIGIVCGILALLFIPTFVLGSQLSGLFNLGGFVLLVIWSVMVGWTLYRLR